MAEFIGAIDQGTTSTRFMVFDRAGRSPPAPRRNTSRSIRSPDGWSTIPHEIWFRTREVIAEAMEQRGLRASRPGGAWASPISAKPPSCGIASTGQPLANALVWQDTRVGDYIPEFSREGGPDRFRAKTGLPLATYFSALKIRWLLDHVPDARQQAEAGEVLFGNIDTFLLWHLDRRCTSPTAPTPAARS